MLVRVVFPVFISGLNAIGLVVLIAGLNVVYAGSTQDLWQVLERDGDALDLMAIESVGDSVLLVAARFEHQWQPTNDETPAAQALSSSLGKKLHIISINSNEAVNWQRSYPAVPDVNEVFAVSSTSENNLCIAYGRQYRENEFINPVVVKLAADGKIIWANSSAIPPLKPASTARMLVQVANLDSINITDSIDNGCVLGFILRYQTAESEKFQVQLVKFDDKGDLQWHFSHDTRLYGKMFLIRDSQAKHFTIVQTNQSRDAAIEAMMAARPFTPQTDLLIVSQEGMLKSVKENITALSKVWVKHIVDAPGNSILLAGNAKSAWAGLMDAQGKVGVINKSLEGEYSYVNRRLKQDYLLVRDESLVSMGSQLNPKFHQPISGIVRKKYSSNYLKARLPDQIPVQNIVPLKNNSYLMLYKLGSKLMKIDVSE